LEILPTGFFAIFLKASNAKILNSLLYLPFVLMYNERSSPYTYWFSAFSALFTLPLFPHNLVVAAQLEVVPTSTSVRHRASQAAVLIENNAIRTGALATVKLSSISHNWEFQIGWRDSEWKTLVVVFGMGVAVASHGLAVLVVTAARAHGVVDIILGIAVVAANSAIGLAG
jgi:hypothetical protein